MGILEYSLLWVMQDIISSTVSQKIPQSPRPWPWQVAAEAWPHTATRSLAGNNKPSGLGFRVQGLVFRGLGFRVQSSGFRGLPSPEGHIPKPEAASSKHEEKRGNESLLS